MNYRFTRRRTRRRMAKIRCWFGPGIYGVVADQLYRNQVVDNILADLGVAGP